MWVAPSGHANCSARPALVCLSAWVSSCTHGSPNYISGFLKIEKKNLKVVPFVKVFKYQKQVLLYMWIHQQNKLLWNRVMSTHFSQRIYNITVKSFIHILDSLVPLYNRVPCYDCLSRPATKNHKKDGDADHFISRYCRLYLQPPQKKKFWSQKLKETHLWIQLIWRCLGVPGSSLITTGEGDGLSGPTGGGCVWVHPSACSAASYQGNHWAAVNGDHLVPMHAVGWSPRAHVIFILRKKKEQITLPFIPISVHSLWKSIIWLSFTSFCSTFSITH